MISLSTVHLLSVGLRGLLIILAEGLGDGSWWFSRQKKSVEGQKKRRKPQEVGITVPASPSG